MEKYTKVIENFREPATIEELMSFLGFVNFLGDWVPELAPLTDPLRELLRLKLTKSANIQSYWKIKQVEAFNKLKSVLLNIRTLRYYDPDDRTQVFADASPVSSHPIRQNKTTCDCIRK